MALETIPCFGYFSALSIKFEMDVSTTLPYLRIRFALVRFQEAKIIESNIWLSWREQKSWVFVSKC